LITAAILLPGPAALAHPPSDEPVDQANETIIVTGQRQPRIEGDQLSRGATLGAFGDRDIYETPVSIKSFTESYIADQIALTSNDLVARDASFSITNSTAINGAGAGRLRGFRMEPFEASYDGFSTIATRRYPLEMIERVDILKGPTAIFTGIVGGVGGTINYVSKKPLDAPLTRLTGLFATQGTLGIQADVSRRFGSNDAFGVRGNLSFRDGESAIDEISERSEVIHLSANWRSGPANLDLQYGNLYSLTSGGMGGYFYNAGVPIGAAPRGDRISGPAWDSREQHDQFVRAALNLDLGNGWSTFAVGGLIRSQERFVGFYTNVVDAAGNAEGGAFAQEGEVDWGDGYNLDLGVRGRVRTGPIEHRLTLAYGRIGSKPAYSDLAADFNYFVTGLNIYDETSFDLPAPALTGGDAFFTLNDTVTQGVVIADEMRLLGDRLLVTVGARYTDIAIASYNYGAPTLPQDIRRYAANDWSPALAVLFKVTPAISVYGNWLKAVEPGSTAPVQAANAGQVIPPGVSEQIEGGIKADFGSFGATAAVFSIQRPSAYIDPVTRIYDSYGRQRHRGVELDLFGTPLPGLRLLASYAYLDAALTENVDPAVNGNRPVSVPEHVLVIGADADVPGIPGAAVLANLRYSSDQAYDVTNERFIPAYAVVDIGVRYRFKVAQTPVAARLNVGNLFDKSYFQSTDFTAQNGAPRTVRFTLSADF
jgi:iron complex outermembrane receptor protein